MSESVSFTDAQRTLFSMLASSLFGRDCAPSENTDWGEVLREAHAQTVIPTVFCNARGHSIPEDILKEIKIALRGGMMRNIAIHNAHTAIHRLLTQNGIPYVILKGAASAYYYPESFLRGMGDVDFYVPSDRLEETVALLRANGFEEAVGNEELHAAWTWRGARFELHYTLPGIPRGPMKGAVLDLFEDLIRESIPTKTDSATFMRPSPLHHGLILLLHTQQHLLCEGIGLRHICDWAVFVQAMGDGFTDLFRKTLEDVGLWHFARVLSLVAVKAAGLPPKTWMTEDPEDQKTAEELLADVLEGGNFGYKDADRSRVYESQLIMGKSPENVKRSRIGNAFSSVNGWVRNRWPVAGKCPLLLPFGWIYFLLHRFFGVITGRKKRLRLRETVQNSRKRQNVYRRLGLFEPQEPPNRQ